MRYRFLIHISYVYGIPIGRPLVTEIERRGYEVKWFSEVPDTLRHFQASDPVLSKAAEVVKYDPHVILSASNIVPDFFPGIKVQVFHGFSVNKRSENKGHFRIRGLFDLYCTQGPSTTEPFLRLAKTFGHFDVVETGWPKMDPLFPIAETPPNGRPCILVSSTFTPRLSLAHNRNMLAELRRLTQEAQYEWILVAHPLMAPEVVEQLKSLQKENVTFHDTTDLVPLFRKADIMISDTTSAIPEFLLQRKPVVTFRNNQPGNQLINVREPSELESAISYALSRPTEVIANIENYITQLHPYQDGHSSARVVDAAIQFLHADKRHLKAKPLNLIRKFKIRKKLQYVTFKTYRRAPTV